LIGLLQSFVSMRRIRVYLQSEEIETTTSARQENSVGFRKCTLAWSKSGTQTQNERWRREGSEQDDDDDDEQQPLNGSTRDDSAGGFRIEGLDFLFPTGEMSLVCGKLGAGKTLLLLGTFLPPIRYWILTCD
jgi:ABC-type multidrug transport system fused ATPase/permease subunit